MQQQMFNRYERKYIITTQEKEALLSFIQSHLIFDPHATNGQPYTIYNIYFDTPDFAIIRNSIQKPVYKEKLRLRSYTYPLGPNDPVFLEIKKKYEGRINKRRIDLSYQEAMDFLERGIMPEFENYESRQIMQEIDYFIKIHKAKPGAFIKYNRIALMSPSDDFRVTFDHQILFRNTNVNFKDDRGTPILASKDLWLMEVKSEDNFPLWLVQKLSSLSIYSQSFSKYGKAYSQYLMGGTNDDFILYHY